LPVFADVTRAAGIRAKHSYGDFELSNIVEGTGAGAMFFDYDGDGTFTEVTREAGLYNPNGRAMSATVADLNNDGHLDLYVTNDGDLDLLVVNLNDSPRLLRNDGGNRHNWLSVSAKLPGGKSDAIGARVTVKTGTLVQVQDVCPVTGYLSQADPRVHFGLGDVDRVDLVEIRWPGGRVTRQQNVATNRFLTVVQDAQTTQ